MSPDYRALCAKVLAYNLGEGQYNFSGLSDYDRDNAAFDAWQEIKAELKSALAQPQPPAGEVGELVAWLRGANWDRKRQTLATRAADLLEQMAATCQIGHKINE